MMELASPNLDDRDWDQLVREARRAIQERCPEWSDLSPNDPGMVLVEVFAYLTDLLIYRVNRIPDKAFIEFLRLLGVRLRPPTAATVGLAFTRSEEFIGRILIPRGTRVCTEDDGPVFRTLEDSEIAAGESEALIRAIHCDVQEHVSVGEGDGQPGMTVTVPHPPILDGSPEERLTLAVFVEIQDEPIRDAADEIEFDGKRFQRWQEVSSFAETTPNDPVYWVDRYSGRIQFAPRLWLEERERRGADPELRAAPEALGRVPRKGGQILATYLHGGGLEGNVAAGVLTKLVSPVEGVTVTNPERGKGGSSAETLEAAVERARHEFRGTERVVTATDYELTALRSSRVARARAFTQRDLWKHAVPGTVEVVLVPSLDREPAAGERITTEELHSHETSDASGVVAKLLDDRRVIGTRSLVSWARYKTVRVCAKVVVHPDRDREEVRRRIMERLNGHISPLGSGGWQSGWRFGQSLHISHIYEICLSEAGVVFVDDVRLLVDERPGGAVSAIAADAHQPQVWYAGNGQLLFRSLNDGKGWELSKALDEGWKIRRVLAHPEREGLLAFLAVSTRDAAKVRVWISEDCGETWPIDRGVAYQVRDIAWLLRGSEVVLLLATKEGLAELPARPDAAIKLQPGSPPDLYSVAVSSTLQGAPSVALGTRHTGVWLSRDAGRTFKDIDPDHSQKHDVRLLRFQDRDGRTWLWAGLTTEGSQQGQGGCIRWELGRTGSARDPDLINRGWDYQTCYGLAFVDDPQESDPSPGRWALAATHKGVVVALDTRAGEPKWERRKETPGLRYVKEGTLPEINGIAERGGSVLVCSDDGIFRSVDRGRSFRDSTPTEELVTLPQTWLFCSGEHEIEVLHELRHEPSSLEPSNEERTP